MWAVTNHAGDASQAWHSAHHDNATVAPGPPRPRCTGSRITPNSRPCANISNATSKPAQVKNHGMQEPQLASPPGPGSRHPAMDGGRQQTAAAAQRKKQCCSRHARVLTASMRRWSEQATLPGANCAGARPEDLALGKFRSTLAAGKLRMAYVRRVRRNWALARPSRPRPFQTPQSRLFQQVRDANNSRVTRGPRPPLPVASSRSHSDHKSAGVRLCTHTVHERLRHRNPYAPCGSTSVKRSNQAAPTA